jgi:STE24 endopeptidase
METLVFLIVFFVIGVAAIQTWAEVLNLGALAPSLPKSFQGVYDAESYEKSQRYTRANTRFGWVSRLFDLALLLLFWAVGGFEWLDVWLRGFGLSSLVTGLLYIGALSLAVIILGVPFRWYDTFVLEEQFGFNRTDRKTFVLDIVKGFAVEVTFGAPVLAGILFFFGWAGAWGWAYAWAAIATFSLVASFIYPTWILPIFNKFSSLEEGVLRTAIFTYADSVGFPLNNVFVMDGSKRSTRSNAYFTGFGKSRRIALFDTLIESHEVNELVGVMAHEVGHYKKRHILKNTLMSIAYFGGLCYLLSIALNSEMLFRAFGVSLPSVYVGLVLFGVLFTPVSFVLSVLMNGLSRRYEFEADRYAVQTTGDPESLARALATLSRTNLSNLTPHEFYVWLTYSHPPVLERIREIRSQS